MFVLTGSYLPSEDEDPQHVVGFVQLTLPRGQPGVADVGTAGDGIAEHAWRPQNCAPHVASVAAARKKSTAKRMNDLDSSGLYGCLPAGLTSNLNLLGKIRKMDNFCVCAIK